MRFVLNFSLNLKAMLTHATPIRNKETNDATKVMANGSTRQVRKLTVENKNLFSTFVTNTFIII